MKRYRMSAAAADTHRPEHPERTAKRYPGIGLDFDAEFQVWPNRAAMARSIRMQEQGPHSRKHWKACIPLGPTEGY